MSVCVRREGGVCVGVGVCYAGGIDDLLVLFLYYQIAVKIVKTGICITLLHVL